MKEFIQKHMELILFFQILVYILISLLYPISFFKNMQNGFYIGDISPLRNFYEEIVDYDLHQDIADKNILKVIVSPEWSPFVSLEIKKPVLMTASCKSISIPRGDFLLISSKEICGEILQAQFCEKDIIRHSKLIILKCNSPINRIYKK